MTRACSRWASSRASRSRSPGARADPALPVPPGPRPPRRALPSYALDGGLADQQDALRRARRSRWWCAAGSSPAVPGEVLTLYALRGKKASKTVRRKVGPRRALRVQVQGRQPGHACGWWSSTRRAPARWPSARATADLGGRLAGGRRRARREGAAAPARAAQGGLRHAGHRLLRRRHRARRAGLPQDERAGPRRLRHQAGLRDAGCATRARSSCATRRRASTSSSTGRARCWCSRSGGKPYRTYHTSSGTPATPTVFGTLPLLPTDAGHERARAWSTRRTSSAATRSTATRRCRAYPASHGCLRVPIPNAPRSSAGSTSATDLHVPVGRPATVHRRLSGRAPAATRQGRLRSCLGNRRRLGRSRRAAGGSRGRRRRGRPPWLLGRAGAASTGVGAATGSGATGAASAPPAGATGSGAAGVTGATSTGGAAGSRLDRCRSDRLDRRRRHGLDRHGHGLDRRGRHRGDRRGPGRPARPRARPGPAPPAAGATGSTGAAGLAGATPATTSGAEPAASDVRRRRGGAAAGFPLRAAPGGGAATGAGGGTGQSVAPPRRRTSPSPPSRECRPARGRSR